MPNIFINIINDRKAQTSQNKEKSNDEVQGVVILESGFTSSAAQGGKSGIAEC